MRFYKYKSSLTIDRDFPYLENNEIWFSKVESLNDPYEGIFKIGDEIKFAINLFFPKRKNAFDKYNSARTSLASAQNKMAGVLSLTTDNINLLMWSHYADNHKGYILEFEFDENSFKPIDKNSNYNPSIDLIKVKYTSKPKNQSIDSATNFVQLTNKSKFWKYEKEFRFISSFYGRYKYENSCLKTIFLGANISNEDEAKFHTFCLSNKIPLYKAKIPSHSYNLEFEKIL
jgi:hypothetical protein